MLERLCDQPDCRALVCPWFACAQDHVTKLLAQGINPKSTDDSRPARISSQLHSNVNRRSPSPHQHRINSGNLRNSGVLQPSDLKQHTTPTHDDPRSRISGKNAGPSRTQGAFAGVTINLMSDSEFYDSDASFESIIKETNEKEEEETAEEAQARVETYLGLHSRRVCLAAGLTPRGTIENTVLIEDINLDYDNITIGPPEVSADEEFAFGAPA
mmetsp:Transcript_35877/g.90404  ORF Transcript_35877/g.90404 Transcript_35877/m.90404 type:complete len:214 (+) Transcript_35877:415-1056(+)